MASNTDTAEIVRIKLADLRWLTFAIRNVQTRTPIESKTRQELIAYLEVTFENNPQMPEFAFAFTQQQSQILLWSANEGRCRDCEEMLIRGRMQRTFTEATGIKGVNDVER